MILFTPCHPEAMLEQARHLEHVAARLRQAARGDWPAAAETSTLDLWSVGSRRVDALDGTRVASGKRHVSSPLLVLDAEGGRAMSLHQTYRLVGPATRR